MNEYFMMPPRIAYIYVMRCKGYYKVGITTDLQRRLNVMRVSNPFPIELEMSREIRRDWAWRVESAVHQHLARYRVTGEWFECPLKEIRAAINLEMQRHHHLPPHRDKWRKTRGVREETRGVAMSDAV